MLKNLFPEIILCKGSLIVCSTVIYHTYLSPKIVAYIILDLFFKKYMFWSIWWEYFLKQYFYFKYLVTFSPVLHLICSRSNWDYTQDFSLVQFCEFYLVSLLVYLGTRCSFAIFGTGQLIHLKNKLLFNSLDFSLIFHEHLSTGACFHAVSCPVLWVFYVLIPCTLTHPPMSVF